MEAKKDVIDKLRLNLPGNAADLLDAFRQYRDMLVHVHLADTDRKALGLGTVDFAAIEAVLQEIGYTGWQSVELPRGDDPDGNGRLPEWFRSL